MAGRLPKLPDDLDSEAERYLREALTLAGRAGRLLVDHLESRGDDETTLEFKGRRELVTAADKNSEKLLVDGLRRAFPDHAFLAEEGVAGPAGHVDREARHSWVVDPLDGTTNFVSGHPFFCVSLGLLREGEPWLGVVHAPLLGGSDGGTFFYGVRDAGAWRDGKRIQVSSTSSLRDAVVATGFAYNRNEPGINTNLANFGRVLMEVRGIRRCGSAALDLALTAAGVYDAFWEVYLGPWDVAAGMALVLAAGGEVCDLGSGDGALHGQEILATNGLITAEIRVLLEGKT